MEKKLLVLDIDGTLVNNEKQITPKTKDALFRAMEAGHSIMIASGRPTPGVQRYVEELRMKEYGGYTLTYNGARVQECGSGKVIYEKRLSREFLPKIYAYAEEHDLGIITYENDLMKDPQVLSGRRLDDWILWEAKINGLTVGEREGFLDYVDYDVYKVLLTSDPEKSEGYMKELQELLGPKVNVMRSEAFFIEITARHIDKARTLERVIGPIGVTQSNTICCGDAFNDISMVKYAGVGVAMGNAKPEVKEVADYITASNEEDGIARVVERFLLCPDEESETYEGGNIMKQL